MKTVLYTCPYVPAEWIAAHGLHPCRIVCSAAGPTAAVPRREGMCPYARAFLNEALTRPGVDAVVMTTLCDQMRRAFDLLAVRSPLPVHLVNVPTTWQGPIVFDYYSEQLRRLGRFLLTLGGVEPSNDHLLDVMGRYQSARQSLLAAETAMTARQWAQRVADFGQQGPTPPVNLATTDTADPRDTQCAIRNTKYEIPLAVIGGPLLKQDFDIYDIIENSGGRIVFDATETGGRGLCRQFDPAVARRDPLTALARAYFDRIHDPSRRPNDPLHVWLKDHCSRRSVRGVIYYRHVWCDAWHGELSRIRDTLALPVLDIEARGDGASGEQRTPDRILAFLEMLV